MDPRPAKRAKIASIANESFPQQGQLYDFHNIGVPHSASASRRDQSESCSRGFPFGANDDRSSTQRQGNLFGDIIIHGSSQVQLGDQIKSTERNSPPHSAADEHDKYEILLKSLLFDRIDARVRNVKRALSSTCKWLFEHDHFKQWHTARGMSEHNGFLWIKGKPGCGKSTIMKEALEWTQKQARKRRKAPTIVSYFFNARAPSSLEKSSLGLYRSLTYQLLRSCASLRPLFTTMFALKRPDDLADAWTQEELQGFLCDAVTSADPFSLCLFVDALDEAEHENDVRQMIGFFVELAERALAPGSLCQLRICLSSRHYPHISIKKGLSLVVEDQPEHGHDIDTYIREKLTGPCGEEKHELSVQVRNKSASIFLWVVLVVDILNTVADHGGSLTDMSARLNTIPGDLNTLFREILVKTPYCIELSITLLQWLVFSMRALEPQELYLATECCRSPADPTWSLPHEVKVPSPDPLAKYILNCSRGLVEVTSTQPPIVQFIHETVREFLIGKDGLPSLLPAPSTNLRGLSHEVLKTGCHRYIKATQIPQNLKQYVTAGHKDKSSLASLKYKLRQELPFIDYAVSCTFNHAEQAQKHGISQESFLKSKIDAQGAWKGLDRLWWNVLEQFKARKYSPNVKLLYFIAEQGYPSLLSTLLKLSNTVNAKCGRYGSALHAACVSGNEQIVRCLLENGANPNMLGGEHQHPLIAAVLSKKFTLIPILQKYEARPSSVLLRKSFSTMVARNSLEGVTILLQLGVDVDARNNRNESALYVAAQHCNESLTELLLDKGAEVNAQGGKYGNALQAAAASFRAEEEIVQILLDAGAEVNAQGGKYGNALQAAAASHWGKEKIVQMLLDAGAEVNAQGGEYGNALQAALCTDKEKIIQILLDAGAEVNAQGGKYGNALQAASYRGKEKIVRILLDAGVEVNTQGGEYGNALQAASYGANEKIVRILFDAGAEVNAQGGEYGNALQAAAASYEPKEKIVQILLDTGAEVNAQGGKYGNALQAASYRGSEKIVQILLDAGADVNARGGEYGNALQAASNGAKEKIVQMLLDAGAEVNAQGGKYGNALQAASYWGREKIVQMLLDAGAEVNARGGEYGNALQAASYRGSEKIVQMLLDAGAEVNAQGGELGSALQAASYRGKEKTVQMLLDAGAEVNARGGKYGNALQATSRARGGKIIQLLLAYRAHSPTAA